MSGGTIQYDFCLTYVAVVCVIKNRFVFPMTFLWKLQMVKRNRFAKDPQIFTAFRPVSAMLFGGKKIMLQIGFFGK